MLTLIEALDYRCLRYIRRPLGRFHVLVGPNASGKTAFLDAFAFLGRLVAEGLEEAVAERTENFQDLVWLRSGNRFELAIEAGIPGDRREKIANPEFDTVRYEVAVGAAEESGEVCLLAERAVLKAQPAAAESPQRELFPMPVEAPRTILSPRAARGARTVINKNVDGHDNYYDETGRGWDHSFRLGPRKSALANLPDDETKFPVTTWLKTFLIEGVQQLVLNSAALRKASAPGQSRGFKPDGSNLPWVVSHLEKSCPERFQAWIGQLRSGLQGMETVRVVERSDDRHRYLVIRSEAGLDAPSWVASDGALRLLALTLPPFLPGFRGVCLIEEPENGIHPRAVEAMYRCLASADQAQILLATHSPVILGLAELDRVLCFAKTPDGATDIVPGSEHPALKNWQGELNLSTLFATGVLG